MFVTLAVCIGCAAKNKEAINENEVLLVIFKVIKKNKTVTKKCNIKLFKWYPKGLRCHIW
jgi:hypothetical protein